MNFLLITVDDMNYDSVGFLGSQVPDITPNIDQLARQGMSFHHAHVTAAICMPSRQCLMTGCYPHNNGAPGFDPIGEDIPTLQEELAKAGYLNGIVGKVDHLSPQHKYCWDSAVQVMNDADGQGRDPDVYYRLCLDFFQRARREKKPFFMMANSHDPHRPLAGSEQELKLFGRHIAARRVYQPEEIEVPGFLPDIPDVRREVAQYMTSVHRADESVGKVLLALRDAGYEQDTVVMFLSDNGMAFPFSKTNCYLASTKTPWIVRWPGVVPAGHQDTSHFITGIDYMPTILELAGLPQSRPMDGRSFLPILQGQALEDRQFAYTVINTNSRHMSFPMRGLQTARFGYIFNAWSDQKTTFVNESMAGLTYRAMVEAAQTDSEIRDRVRLFDYRVKEELYDFSNDPNGLVNLTGDPDSQDTLRQMRQTMLTFMKKSGDPLLKDFIHMTNI